MTPDELNQRCYDALVNEGVKDGSFVLVVGAGVSIPLIPSGGGLRETMATACDITNDENEPFWDFFQRIQDDFPEIYRETIIRTFSGVPEWHSEACHQIVCIPNKSIITLNYDDHLQSAFSRKFGSGWQQRFAIYPAQAQKSFAFPSEFRHSPHLLAAHGYRIRDEAASNPDLKANWPNDGIILTKRQFEDHYFGQDRGHYLFHWWKEVLCQFSCLFIGTSLQEPGLHKVIESLLKEKQPDFLEKKRILLQDVRPQRIDSELDDHLIYQTPVSPLQAVQQVLFDPKQGYRGLLEILSKLSGEPLRGPLESAKQAPTFPDSFKLSISEP